MRERAKMEVGGGRGTVLKLSGVLWSHRVDIKMQRKWCSTVSMDSTWDDEVLWWIIIVTYFTFDAIYLHKWTHIKESVRIFCSTMLCRAMTSHPMLCYAMLFTFSFDFSRVLGEVFTVSVSYATHRNQS